jgi:dCTP deaminase
MFLSDHDIETAIADGEISIHPFDRRLLKRNSYLLRLAPDHRRIAPGFVVDTADPEHYPFLQGVDGTADSFVVDAESLVLGCSLEQISVSASIIGMLSGISNVARLGVLLHSTSEIVNAGFARGKPSRLVFEMATIGGMRVRMYSGTPVCHLLFARLQTPTRHAVDSERTGQDGPDPSRLLAQFGHFFQPDPLNVPAAVRASGDPVVEPA